MVEWIWATPNHFGNKCPSSGALWVYVISAIWASVTRQLSQMAFDYISVFGVCLFFFLCFSQFLSDTQTVHELLACCHVGGRHCIEIWSSMCIAWVCFCSPSLSLTLVLSPTTTEFSLQFFICQITHDNQFEFAHQFHAIQAGNDIVSVLKCVAHTHHDIFFFFFYFSFFLYESWRFVARKSFSLSEFSLALVLERWLQNVFCM